MNPTNHISLDFSQNLQSSTKQLLSFAMSLTKNNTDAEDLYQDTVFLAFKNKDKFSSGTNFTAWLKTIMRNTFINNYRKQKRFQSILAKGVGGYFFGTKSSDNSTEADMNVKEIERLIGDIDVRFKTPFLLYFTGYSYDEIAEQLDLPMGTVKSRIFFARKHLKESYNMLFSN
ncbi:MAG: RNA polymerase sigma-70 factor (ECF subfamily) [Saprospiraceae bacterium]|jgi:RNA polymerase sigma-70 factor (ECF subfamily)